MTSWRLFCLIALISAFGASALHHFEPEANDSSLNRVRIDTKSTKRRLEGWAPGAAGRFKHGVSGGEGGAGFGEGRGGMRRRKHPKRLRKDLDGGDGEGSDGIGIGGTGSGQQDGEAPSALSTLRHKVVDPFQDLAKYLSDQKGNANKAASEDSSVVPAATDRSEAVPDSVAAVNGAGEMSGSGGVREEEGGEDAHPNIFRRGIKKASSLIRDINGAIFGKDSVDVIHPITGVKTTYGNIKTSYEKEDLTLHMCNEPGEAYSAAYLTTKQHMLEVNSQDFNLTWVNCEMASFIHMRKAARHMHDAQSPGMIMQSLDVMDFSVIHLSAFERVSKRYRKELWPKGEHHRFAEIPAVKAAADELEKLIKPSMSGHNITFTEDAKRTVVIMPFLGGSMGAGHSELGNRFVYLKACFWSLYQFFPNIVAGVTREQDVAWIKQDSGLPFFDVLLLDDLPKPAGLPVGLTQRTRALLKPGMPWDALFDFVYFTESDQILIWRTMKHSYDHLRQYPHRMLLPHRLMPYSDRAAKEIHGKELVEDPHAWQKMSCCLPRQNCDNRLTWVNLREPSVPMMNYLGLHVPLGNVDFLLERYRACTMMPQMLDEYTFCP